MFFAMVTFFLRFLVDLLMTKRKKDHEKDLEIALLRQQLRIVSRRQTKGLLLPRWQKLVMVGGGSDSLADHNLCLFARL